MPIYLKNSSSPRQPKAFESDTSHGRGAQGCIERTPLLHLALSWVMHG